MFDTVEAFTAGAATQRVAPRGELREFLDHAQRLQPVHEGVALQERRVGGIDQRELRPVEVGPVVAALRERLVELLEGLGHLGRARGELLFRIGIHRVRDRAGEGRHVVGPRAVARARDRILRMQPRLGGLLQVFGDGVRLEERLLAVDLQHRHLGMRRDGEKPRRAVVAVDVGDVVGDLLRLQHDRRALNPGAGLEAAKHEPGRHVTSV